MKVGFSVIIRGQTIEFQIFGSKVGKELPIVKLFKTADQVIVLMGQIYYQRDLLEELASYLLRHQVAECMSNQAALVLYAYQHLGVDGIERLEGDFSLAIWDGKAEHLILSRDPMGGYPLFWTSLTDGIAVSTSIYPLLTHLPRRAFDSEYMAEYLTLPWQVMEVFSDRCVYQGIHRVLAGTLLHFQARTGAIQQHQYWDWLDRQIDPGSNELEAIAEGYKDLLQDAVRERVSGQTASHLSGGMDSTAIAIMANRLIKTRPDQRSLHTLSLVYNHLPGLTDEQSYINHVLQHHTDMVPHLISSDELLDFNSFEGCPLHDEPYAGLHRLALDRATVDTAVNCDAQIMLTGIGSDEMMVMSPFHLADLLRQGAVRKAWSEACKWAKTDNCSSWQMLYSYGIVNSLPGWMQGGMGAMLNHGHTSWNQQNKWTIAPWILPEFARHFRLRDRMIHRFDQIFGTSRPTALSFAVAAIQSRIGDVDRWALAAPQGLSIAHPFMDSRVLRFGLGLQARVTPIPEGQKPILAYAMRDTLPEMITNRRTKADFGKIYYLGLAKNLKKLEAMIEQSPINELGLLNKMSLVNCLHQATLGLTTGVDGLHRLNLTLSLMKWLAMQDEWCATITQPDQVIQLKFR